MDKKTIAAAALIMLVASASAARMGVVVEYPNGTLHTECVRVDAGTDGYKTLEETLLAITWSPAGVWGHGLCGIEDVGCPPENCYCSGDYWALLLAEHGDDSWNYLPVGFDAPGECWNHEYDSYAGHYCAADGDVIGLAYGPWGTQPDFVGFTDICGPEVGRSSRTQRIIEPSIAGRTRSVENQKTDAGVFMVVAGEPATLVLVDEKTGETLDKAEVGIYEGTPGASGKIFEGATDQDGRIEFTLEEPGTYRARLSKSRYPHRYLTIKASQKINRETTTIVASTTSIPIRETLETTIGEVQQPPQETTVEATTTVELKPPAPSATVTTTVGRKHSNVVGLVVAEKAGGNKSLLLVVVLAAVAVFAAAKRK